MEDIKQNIELDKDYMDINKPKITDKEIKKAREILRKYKAGKTNLEARVIAAEEWWKLNHWEQFKVKSRNANAPKPVSSWMFNSIINKHADMMDNFPEPNVLPREQSDEEVAEVLSNILPVILENRDFEKTYSSVGWDKLKAGTGIYGVFFNPRLENGLGDVDIKRLDILNIFWEPGITDSIQDSKNLFIVELVDKEIIKNIYPDISENIKDSTNDLSKYQYDDTVDTSDKLMVIDWYYKVDYAGKEILHYVKFVNDIVLFASENEEEYKDIGYYEHGKYPVVFDVMFEEKGTPAGFGYVDIMKNPQEYIDKLDQCMLKSSIALSKPRYFIKDSTGVNEEEFVDIDKDIVHVAGALDDIGIRRVDTEPIPAQYLQARQAKIDELKETSGNRDFSQGSTTSGVTAASAIAALQEAGSKTSRDMNRGSYRAYQEICNIVIELIRQFYDEPRIFRIIGDKNDKKYINFSNAIIKNEENTNDFGVELAGRKAVFDVKVRPQKASPFSRLAQNELALQFFDKGFFNPELTDQALAAIEMMDFEGKHSVIEKIRNNGSMYEKLQQQQQQMIQMAEIIAQATGDTRLLEQFMGNGVQAGTISPNGYGSSEMINTDMYGSALNVDNSQAGKARESSMEMASIK